MPVMDLFQKSLEVPPPPGCPSEPNCCSEFTMAAMLHPRRRGNAVSATYFYSIYFNIILPSTCIFSQSFKISYQHFVQTSVPCVLHALRISSFLI